jgi:flagellar hook-associated protein 3 FlgL
MNIRSGAEQFQVATGVRNAGNGVISTGGITDPIAYQNDFMGHEYRIDFTTATTFDVIEVTNGVDSSTQVLSNQAYIAGQPISFRGMQVSISGAPNKGDDFTVKTAQNNSLFKVLDNLISTLNAPSGTPVEHALLTGSLANALTDLDQGLQHLSQLQGSIGSRMNALDAQDGVNQTFNLQLKELQINIGAVDYADAASRLSEEQLALQAAQQSFLKIQGLSLFNYLK